ncbi:MAG: hypothetical protein DWQ34_11240 [Planctomycetota bacterium]|nr:MAG: hypothetical protein DWQ34_11240 [Planctomycetota bacterium]REK30033.1 MAG: hypothetical protein DWQ41_02545 [Planctomycetota bacterium]
MAYRNWGGGSLVPIMIGWAAVTAAMVSAVRLSALTPERPLYGMIVGVVAGFLVPPQVDMSPSIRRHLIETQLLYEFDKIALSIACIAIGTSIGVLIARRRPIAPT